MQQYKKQSRSGVLKLGKIKKKLTKSGKKNVWQSGGNGLTPPRTACLLFACRQSLCIWRWPWAGSRGSWQRWARRPGRGTDSQSSRRGRFPGGEENKKNKRYGSLEREELSLYQVWSKLVPSFLPIERMSCHYIVSSLKQIGPLFAPYRENVMSLHCVKFEANWSPLCSL